MENLKSITETKHSELLALLNPLVDFMTANNFSYFLVAGKDGTCTRHMRGNFHDITGMLTGMMETSSAAMVMLEHSVHQNKIKHEKEQPMFEQAIGGKGYD